eukprot:TRINITY_DN950_c0_g2_i1.p1 TRINITY_DN950_c0_g2~~TRINITY_DN950_c0_g2_i1.p1  ORF type:complete len:176 (+),score=33.34 TRINITY_DN950_c0_g2_i1:67-528(+)
MGTDQPPPSAPPMPGQGYPGVAHQQAGGYQQNMQQQQMQQQPPMQQQQPMQQYPPMQQQQQQQQYPPMQQQMQHPPVGVPVGQGPQVIKGVQPHPNFPDSEKRRLPKCGHCGQYNGVPGARFGVLFICWNCQTTCQLPPGWIPPVKIGFCAIL